MDEIDLDEINFDAILAEIDRKTADLKASESRLAAVSTTSQSADGLVEVTVSATGAVTAVRLAPETFRRSTPQYLGQSVVEAAQQATRQVRQSAQAVAAPMTELSRSLAAAIEEPRPASSHTTAEQPTDAGAQAISNDKAVQVGVDALGIVVVVQISPNAYHNSNTDRLAAAITEAAARAARQMYETRMSPMESVLGEAEALAGDEFFPVPSSVEPAAPTTPPAPPIPPRPPELRPSPSASTPAGYVVPGTRGPNRDQVVGPSDWDQDDGYGSPRRSWLS